MGFYPHHVKSRLVAVSALITPDVVNGLITPDVVNGLITPDVLHGLLTPDVVNRPRAAFKIVAARLAVRGAFKIVACFLHNGNSKDCLRKIFASFDFPYLKN